MIPFLIPSSPPLPGVYPPSRIDIFWLLSRVEQSCGGAAKMKTEKRFNFIPLISLHIYNTFVSECYKNLIILYLYARSIFTLCVVVDSTHECSEKNKSKQSILVGAIASNLS